MEISPLILTGIITLGIAFGSLLFWAGSWIGGVNEHRKGVEADMKEIREDLKFLRSKIEKVKDEVRDE